MHCQCCMVFVLGGLCPPLKHFKGTLAPLSPLVPPPMTIAQDMLANLYVDNIVTGCDSEEDAILYYNTACSVMKEAQFNLRSWASSSHKLHKLASQDHVADSNHMVNVLGLQWDTQNDTMSLTSKFPIPVATTLVTKREVLRESSKVFDPLGLLSPVTIKARVFMQTLWQHNVVGRTIV